MDAGLQEMIEARAIEQLMVRYIDRVDANDPVGAAACFAEDGDHLHYWGRWVDELRKIDGQWLFTRREVVGVGTMVPGDTERDRPHPGHPGRVPVESER